MSETKLEAKQWDHSENFRYHSENLALRKFRNVCEIFAMSNSDFFFFEKKKLINKNKNKNNKILKIKIKTFFL